MELIHYADGSILTGSAIARALVNYAQVLASHGTADSVEVPTREPDGSVSRATFLLGPASQLVSVAVDSKFDEVTDDELVARLRAETVRQRGGKVMPGDQRDDGTPRNLEALEQFRPVDIPLEEA